MARGVLIAIIVTALWAGLQIAFMHVRPARNRFFSMLTGYLFSLPLVPLLYYGKPELTFLPGIGNEAAWMGLFHALLLHLLLFFLYVECFYHVERSVTLRLMVTLLHKEDKKADLNELQGEYSLDEMIDTRLDRLIENNFMKGDSALGTPDEQISLTGKGKLFARAMAFSTWLFQSEGQHQRS